ncbi:uncharacterized protein VP01_1792g4 [Puccinia sorghi]|uniref:Uncharacterized protein n=1 Tax=Puccinia sorghi TaxID=27349 RepID=A0A0L6VGC8_9BASI|nr:uncharacterized protein VP01_1792g4 [Puccinia sorghi]
MSHSNLERFVSDLTDYNPKTLWDSIVSHFAAKKVENSTNALDCLFNTQFIVGEMEKLVSSNLEKKLLEAVAIFALKPLPPSFALKIELRRQGETHIQQAESAKALALTPAAQTQPPPLPQKNAVVNNPAVKIESKILNHNIWRCHLHLEKAIAFNQAAVEQHHTGQCIHLKNQTYFQSLNTVSSSVYGANGAAIPILGFGPATIPTVSGPVHLNLAYFTLSLSNSLISLTFYLCQGFSVVPTGNGSCFECQKGSKVLLSGTKMADLLIVDNKPL